MPQIELITSFLIHFHLIHNPVPLLVIHQKG
ncbi:hypothetical protein Gogos_013096 [Gossypium gossypioides]|uniref:Uncharacterized protein n=1 Tax=Gossypium gossypioides TaxID=34282 RepID=A0A7J9BUM5_GOSGO|nr:hypothetical protein [Gossypium gossypioides]